MILVLDLLFVLLSWIFLAKVKVYPEESIFSGETFDTFTPILIEITYKRRIFEVLLDFILVIILPKNWTVV